MTLTRNILAHLEQHGPSSCATLVEALEAPSNTVSKIVSRLHRTSKQLYVVRYERGTESELHRARKVYALGDKKDASRPRPDERAKRKRWYDKTKRLSTMNNVFNLGLTHVHWKNPT